VVGLVSLASSLLLGLLLIYRWTDVPALHPGWLRWLWLFGTGTVFGIGLSSCLFFVFGVVLGSPTASLAVELATMAWTGYALARRGVPRIPLANKNRSSKLHGPIAIGVLAALGLATAAMTIAWRANAYGDWDAWALWCLRAKMLASGHDLAARAWSPVLATTTHPEYPLLLSSFVARCWAFDDSFSQAIPAITSYVFFVALISMVWAGVAMLRGPALGAMAALLLAATPSLLHEVPNQYADVPLASYFVAAIISALLDLPVLSGIFASLAAWTKDEGGLFLILLLAEITVLKRKALPKMLVGALPAGMLVALFKMVLARGNASLLTSSVSGAAQRVADGSRYWTIVQAFAREFAGMGTNWYHPLLPLAILALALRFDGGRWREAAFCGAILTGVLAGDFGAYLITSNSLTWQLQTSLNRLLVQAWPVFVLAAALMLRIPESTAQFEAAPGTKI
jgi:hypothetical protein